MWRDNQSMRQGLKLPFALQQELGLKGQSAASGRRRHSGGATRDRREQRKAGRLEKRQHVRGSKKPHAKQTTFRQDLSDNEEDAARSLPTVTRPLQSNTNARVEHSKPRSILRKPKQPSLSPPPSEQFSSFSSRSSSPGLVLDASSRAFKDRAAQDDAEITALEKKLGLKKNKAHKSLVEDGLDDLLDGLDEGEEEPRGVKRKTEGKEWLERKRRKAAGTDNDSDMDDDLDEVLDLDNDDEDGLDVDEDSEDDLAADLEDHLDEHDSEEDMEHGGADSFDGLESEEDPPPVMQPKKVRENPYVAPSASTAPTAKYIPPSLRKAQHSEGASLERLKKKLQGHLNKLSGANLISILGEIEKVYRVNPRQDVTSVLIELLLTPFCDRSALPNTFVILHAAFATAVYKVVGVDFGADLLSQLIERFDQYHSDDATGKEALNLISLLSNLFTFHVVGSAVVFDHVRLLLGRLSENNTELLLRLIRDCGPQLRQDDASSLKAIIQLMQKEKARMITAGEEMSVRTKFMIETMTDLKNNKMKAATNNAGPTGEHIKLMRKLLGSLNEKRSLRSSEPLRITRDDIKNSDKKGKWWLVGASWKGHDATAASDEPLDQPTPDPNETPNEGAIDLLALSRQHGMHTDVRRSIFIALLSGVDYHDGHLRILKLRLKPQQVPEIPKVLLRCAAGEKSYNRYYTAVAKKLCLDKKTRKAFQFALWGFFRRLGETDELDDDEDEIDHEDESIEMSEIAVVARLYAGLVLDGAVPLGVLKVLDFATARERTRMFVELMLAILFVDATPEALAKILERTAAETPQMVKRLQFFIKKNVRSSDLLEERKALKRGCQVALDTLKRLGQSRGD